MRLVYKFHIPYNEQLYNLCKISKNLYNQTLYIIKQELKTNNRWLSYYDTDKMMKDIINLEGEINYKLLKAQVAQQCLKQLDKNVKSYVKSIKDWKKHKEKYPPKTIWVSSSRIMCAKNGDFETMIEGGGSAVAYAWYIWEKGFKGETTLKWFN